VSKTVIVSAEDLAIGLSCPRELTFFTFTRGPPPIPHRRFFFTFTSHTEPTPAAPTHRHANRAAQIPFKLIGRRIEQEDILLDYICGHAPATVGRGYGEPTLKDLAQVIQRFPRYET